VLEIPNTAARLQVYVVVNPAVLVMVYDWGTPLHIISDNALLIRGVVAAVTFTIAVTGAQSVLSATETVYVPAVVTVGEAKVDVKPPGPLHEYRYPAAEFPPVTFAFN
jgi:hypothetical protein